MLAVDHTHVGVGETFHFHKHELTSSYGGRGVFPHVGWLSPFWAVAHNNRTGVTAPIALAPEAAGGTAGTAYGYYTNEAIRNSGNWRVGDLVTLVDQCYIALAVYDAGLAGGNSMTPADWGWDDSNCAGCL